MAGPSSAAAAALKTFELENNIEETDMVYKYDNATNQKNLSGKGWTKDPRWFKHVRISALALVKITMHARSGGDLEVMGLMVGKIDPDDPRGPTMIVLDCFALPVEGTETRVNAQADAYEYMVEFLSTAKEAGRLENVLGWYHSHPGYGCWLSGIDVSTQMLNQQYQEPWLAIVIDPHKTAATGKVEIGAFRTYPQGYKPPEGEDSEFESVPLSKIEDFGVHKNQYYQLEVSYFKSACDTALLSGAPPSLHSTRISTQGGRAKRASQERARRHPPAALHADPARANTAHFFSSRPLLPHCHACLPATNMSTDSRPALSACHARAAIWNKYWIATLSASPLLSNAPYISAQMKDIADKLESAEGGLSHFGRGGGAGAAGGSYLLGGERSKKDDSQLKKIVRDASKLTREHLQAAMTQAMKNILFNSASNGSGASAMDTD